MKTRIEQCDLVGISLTRSVTPEQINANRGNGNLRRYVEVRQIDEDARTVEVAFSSETPVPRWFGEEILDHSAGAMDDNRLRNGAAVLWNHNSDIHIGVVESAQIDNDRRGRAVLRFGRSGRAEEIWSDVVDGVIRHVSVGYQVHAVTTEEIEGEPDKVTITRWEPHEISFVSVPADASIGIGRSAGEAPEEARPAPNNTDSHNGAGSGDEEEQPTEERGSGMERILRNTNGDLVRAKVDDNGNITEVLEVLERASETRSLVQEGTEAERTRTAALLELGEQYSAQRLAAEAIRDNTGVDEFTRTLLEHVSGSGDTGSGNSSTRGGGNRPLADDGGEIGLTESEASRFSFMRALRALANPTDRRLQEEAAFEYEASAAAAQAQDRDARGIMVPMDVLRRALNTDTSGTNPGDTGGFAVGTTLLSESFIDLLRNRSVFLQMATPLGGLVGNLTIPGQASGASGFWLDEDEDAGEGTQDLRDIDLNPNTVGAFSEATRRQLMQASVDSEGLMRRDLAAALALTIDLAGYYGDGNKKPLGIKNLPGVNAVDFDAVWPSYAKLVEMESAISADNADVNSMAYVSNAQFRGHCKTTQKFAGTNGQPIWEAGGTVNGYRTEITNQITDGDVFHGNFADAIVGMWGGLDLTVDPYTHSKKGRVRIVAFQDVDIAFRHIESFCYGTDVI